MFTTKQQIITFPQTPKYSFKGDISISYIRLRKAKIEVSFLCAFRGSIVWEMRKNDFSSSFNVVYELFSRNAEPQVAAN